MVAAPALAKGLTVARILATGAPQPLVIVGCAWHAPAELATATADLVREGIEHVAESWPLPDCPGAFAVGAMLIERYGEICCPFCRELRGAS